MNFSCRFLVLFALLSVCQPALAEKRVALVVGNSHYDNAPLLPNPANDAAAIAATLNGAGFDVVESKLDLGSVEMRRVLRDFSDQARDADIAVVYYAGHGIEMDGTNYLIPTDAKLERDTDIYDEAFSLDRVLLAIEPARQLRLVIVDACRNNPFADTMRRTVSARSVSRGLARVEPAATNTLVAFAAKAGLTALDGNNRNSPYAAALIKYIAQPGLDLRKAFGFVRDDVMQATGNRQEPYVYGSLGGADVALVPAKPVGAPVASTQSEDRHDYELAMQLNNKDALNAFLAQHPDGYYARLAKLQLAKIIAEAPKVAAANQAGAIDHGQARLTVQGGAPGTASGQAAPNLTPAPDATDTTKAIEPAQADQHIAPEAPAAATPPQTQVATGDAGANGMSAGPASVAPPATGPSPAEIAKSAQSELRRVGCLAGKADGDWNAASERSLAKFNRYAGTKFDTRIASSDALDAIRQKPARVCPLVCEHGFRVDGDQCRKIVCADGTFLNDDNECEKRRGKMRAAKHSPAAPSSRSTEDEPQAPRTRSPRAVASRSSGQIICDSLSCRPVRRGCHLDNDPRYALKGAGGVAEICN
ncbi:MAG TPA: caspase family protein [Bradyrhizobium sp.]|nr:caspase family protein [Bradyrhizobium sp.]